MKKVIKIQDKRSQKVVEKMVKELTLEGFRRLGIKLG